MNDPVFDAFNLTINVWLINKDIIKLQRELESRERTRLEAIDKLSEKQKEDLQKRITEWNKNNPHN